MGLLSKEIEVTLGGHNIKWYEDKGYNVNRIFDKYNNYAVKRGSKINVRVEDLQNSSKSKANIECDGCNTVYDVIWSSYTKNVKSDGKYFCRNCAGNGNERIKSIAETHPQLVRYFVNKEDTKNYSRGSHTKVDMVCPSCGNIKERDIHQMVAHGLACKKCGDGISFSEKFVYNLLEQLGLEFQTQLNKGDFKWCGKYSYDFYIPNFGIIETHGLQHYEETGERTKWGLLKDVQDNDKIKEELAKSNGIEKYIQLNCSKSTLDYIKNSILNSELNRLFDLTKIDWIKCYENSCNSVVIKVCNLWNETNGEIGTREIGRILKLNICTVGKYLKQGVKIGYCNYIPKTEVSVICLNSGMKFDMVKQGGDEYKISPSSISQCCQGKTPSAGKHPITNEPLRWQYCSDYLLQVGDKVV